MDTLLIIIWLIFVQPSGETFTEQEQQEAVQATQAALNFWNIDAEIRTQIILVDNPYTVPTWAISSQTEKRLYVIDNSQSKSLFFGNLSGYADHYHGFASVVNSSYMPATIAHEFGHLWYNADDLYKIPGLCNQLDIMCDAYSAYNANTIGCLTLERIGRTCYRVYLPHIETMDTTQQMINLLNLTQRMAILSGIPIEDDIIEFLRKDLANLQSGENMVLAWRETLMMYIVTLSQAVEETAKDKLQ